jgi:hypothetical protein
MGHERRDHGSAAADILTTRGRWLKLVRQVSTAPMAVFTPSPDGERRLTLALHAPSVLVPGSLPARRLSFRALEKPT